MTGQTEAFPSKKKISLVVSYSTMEPDPYKKGEFEEVWKKQAEIEMETDQDFAKKIFKSVSKIIADEAQ